ncbi:type II secretion system GspH family protein [Candidatus Parcubacteria bacterium]|nr:type II secretion system GspH family protein [Candidatus Parcubacteria bacterium]
MSWPPKLNRGFTLIELLVTMTIMALIMGVVVIHQNQYTDGIYIRNAVDTLALAVRQAQVYGTSVRELTPGTNNFSTPYGISFDSTAMSTNSAYVFFADVNSNQSYDGSFINCSGQECIELTSVSGNDYISAFCDILSNGTEVCDNTINKVDIIFLRPETKARIRLNGGDITAFPGSPQAVRVKLTSPFGETHSVTVYKTGQISSL